MTTGTGKGPRTRQAEGKTPVGSPRSLIVTVGIVVLLIAAIALANGGWQGDNSGPESHSGTTDGKPAPYGHTRAGAKAAAKEYATRLGSDRMYRPQDRHEILQEIVDPQVRGKRIAEFDSAYTSQFLAKIGLDKQGRAPHGMEFVSRTMPASTDITTWTPDKAQVDVWCSGIFGLKGDGPKKEIPVENGWFTMTLSVRWTDDGWKLSKSEQTDGPDPSDPQAPTPDQQ
ncbi:hypothetical protein [Streptomyces sp. NPDC056723]|uniref:hypothetical protein n=1 Tax=Streptomyces sp. NPDC056723 TaxID=3345925 RepID=UPI0036984F0E